MWENIPTPCYVVDEEKLRKNLTILQSLERDTGCHVLLAQKAFSMYALYPMIGQYISGTTASGLFEARLGREEMGKENHVFAPAYKERDMAELVKLCDHIIFNSVAQYEKHRGTIAAYNRTAEKKVSIGLRVNPEYSSQEGHAIYDPCAPGSRLGITQEELAKGLAHMGSVQEMAGIGGMTSMPKRLHVPRLTEDVEGLHFHTLCEQDADALEDTFDVFEAKFEPYLRDIKWINLGGGHHITRPGYQLDRLKKLILRIREEYGVEVYLEPGEAIALNAGYLVTEVCDIVHNGIDILILDTSAACHMPDVLEMPYRPPLQDGYPAGEKPHTYRLSSLTCLAGDVIGDYSFEREMHVGDRLVFEDMAIYSMVKNNTFNGIPLPAIAVKKENGDVKLVREFGYDDFKGRLS